MNKAKKNRSKEELTLMRKALKKKLDALRTLKSLEGKYESTEEGDETTNKRIQAFVDLHEADKTLEELEKKA